MITNMTQTPTDMMQRLAPMQNRLSSENQSHVKSETFVTLHCLEPMQCKKHLRTPSEDLLPIRQDV